MNIDGYGRIAVVTGAGQGLGLSIAKDLLESGKKVVLIDVNKQALEEIKNSEFIQSKYEARSMFLEIDVANVQEIRSGVGAIIQKWGRIDILVNNAGVRKETAIEDIDIEEWNDIVSVNLGGTFFFSQAVIDTMKKQKWGRIINMSSFGGQFGPLTSGAHYCASKAGQLVLTKVFARELADKGITVNTIAPAAIRTPEMEKIDPQKLEKIISNIPVGRVGEETEVSKLVSYLISESAGYITGSTFDINGGLLMR
ncbi:SDR family NAD(P)-dependent oxidoreductase [Anaerobacillus isosaccharinicus]|uniref:3-oxoacyl-ACP reductase n=1 Tax=Anaerobacillus isosaccharinicus TaxID=1532552 RepID=A0A1S2M901_9BACI|nr:SDR family NAD(P)-dependent oxidoreductase [Anaerobacillus isosaccharinicus]MBA5587200.1 SDR family oxidoreductase [Anaerobacillus isosaccharinicus]QOY34605.1 SDR family oxidoreductase [Anaerobacillus isosaccharinicus]